MNIRRKTLSRQSRSHLDGVFAALADPTRRAIIARLALGDAYVSELTEPHDMSFAAVSRHIQVLESTGLASRIKEGRKIRCRLNAEPLAEVFDWVRHYRRFWDQKLDSLGDFLEREE